MYQPIADWSDRAQTRNRRGYVIIAVPEHPRNHRGGWVYEHKLVYERYLGRLLHKWETVHHISEVKHDNRLDNLFVCTFEEHRKAHDLCFSM